MKRRRQRIPRDAYIHRLEYELGLRDDRPPGGPQTAANLIAVMTEVYANTDRSRQVYACPVHGLIENPRRFAAPDWDGGLQYICPINLSTDEGGITDDLCQEACTGPITVIVSG